MLNADDEYVSQFGRDFKGKVVTYGTCATADIRPRTPYHSRRRGFGVRSWCISDVREHARLPLVGEHNILNALAAVAVGLARG